MNFIYVINSNLKDKLIQKGYRLIKQESMQDQTAWVFEYRPEIQFDVSDKTKYFTLNTLRF